MKKEHKTTRSVIKKAQKSTGKQVQGVDNTTDVENSPLVSVLGCKPINVTNTRSAKRVLSKLITAIQMGKVPSPIVKNLVYALSTFCQIMRDVDFEERLKKLEKSSKQGSEDD